MHFILFVLKKLTASLLLPLPMGIICGILGLILVVYTQRRNLGLFFIILGLAIPTVFSLDAVSQALLSPLEAQYPPLLQIPPHINTIVVLGGGNGGEGRFPANTRLGAASLSRLIEGIRLYHQLTQQHIAAKLILSGGRVFRSYPEAGRLKNTAVVLGINPSHIIIENGSQDTHDEAIYLKPMLGTQPFILVTSAYHMPRSMALFENQGMHPIAAPTQYFTHMSRNLLRSYIPNSTSLFASDTALHEYLGLFWAKISNKA